jgi:hypothetical protein
MSAKPDPTLGLTEIQARFAKGIMRALTPTDGIDPVWVDGSATAAAAESIVKANDRLTSLERMEIYNRQYWFRIWDSLTEDFPGVRRILGKSRFYKTMTDYVTKNPSESFTLRNLGHKLPGYLMKEKGWKQGLSQARAEMTQQMAVFEWAQMEAFDGLVRPVVRPEDLAGSDPAELELSLQPNISLLEMDYALDDFTIALKKAGQDSKAVALPQKAHLYVMVHRQEETIYYRRMDVGAYSVLKALDEGIVLEKALELGQKASGESDRRWAKSVQAQFGLWARLGWLCAGSR